MKIYYQKHSKRLKEGKFFNYLKFLYPNLRHFNEKYILPERLLGKSLNKNEIIKGIENVNNISELKKQRCVSELKKLPNKILVVNSMSDISVDFVIEAEDKKYFIEFHEKQHKIDSNKRDKNIYAQENREEIKVPRYLQRLLRDIWRWKYLSNYKIVWFDWFEANSCAFLKDEILSENNKEYALEKKFKISDII